MLVPRHAYPNGSKHRLSSTRTPWPDPRCTYGYTCGLSRLPGTPSRYLSGRQGKRGGVLSSKRTEAGFTILELIVSIGIFSVVITSLSSGVKNLIVLNNRSRDLAITNIIAENKAEQIRSAGFNSLSVGSVDFTAELPSQLAPPRSGTYTITNPSSGVMEAMITITYKDYNRTRTQTYKTVISELGVGQ